MVVVVVVVLVVVVVVVLVVLVVVGGLISRVPDQNGVSQACYTVEIHHSGPEPSKLSN